MRLLSTLLLLFVTLSLFGQERFTDWQTDIQLNRDRSIEVTENVTVVATGDVIKRGITRSLPRDSDYPLEVLSVERDGRAEAFHTDKKRGKLVIYAGSEDVFLDPGTYTYRIHYRIENAVIPRREFDELQFEVVGPQVAFPVEKLSATLNIPTDLNVSQYACYTGETGSTSQDCTMSNPRDGALIYTAAGRLAPGEALSVAAGFEQGFFAAAEPQKTLEEEIAERSWLQKEGSFLFLLLGFISFAYYAYNSWRKHGVDPPTPDVGNVYAPPRGASPATIGILMYSLPIVSNEHFTASLISLAINDYLVIEPEEEKGFLSSQVVYHLRATGRKPAPGELPKEQQALYDRLFADGDDVRLGAEYDKKFQKVSKAHSDSLTDQHKAFFNDGSNGKHIIPLVAIYILFAIPAVLLLKTDTTGYAIPLLVAYGILGLLGILAYAFLIRKPSPDKVRYRAEIKAFKEYLSLPEKKRSRLLNAPKMTPEHYEALLPYAIALGINKKWSNYFGELLSRETYHPVWYVGGASAFNANSFTNNFNSVVSSTATVPGSASSGGGSVGGGVGGGGAGGW